MTFAAFMAQWLEAVRPSLRPSTWRRYEQYARLHALPALGGLRLDEVGAAQLHQLYAERLAAGCSPTSIRHLHRFLHRVFAHAVRWGNATGNPVERVDPPRPDIPEFGTLSAQQAQALVAAARADRLHALYVLALTTGMRQGELLALRWADIDLPASRAASAPVPRPAPHCRNAAPGDRRSPKDRQRDARPHLCRHHHRPLLARHAGHA